MLGLGMLTADWHLDVLRCRGVKSGWEEQNSTAAECGGVLSGADLAVVAWAVSEALIHAMVVAM